jgi:hypothetical protein
MITCNLNATMEAFHDRTLLIVDPQDYDRRLGDVGPSQLPMDLVQTYPAEWTKAWKIAPAEWTKAWKIAKLNDWVLAEKSCPKRPHCAGRLMTYTPQEHQKNFHQAPT